uniref:UBC core domain-containing protein n=1 Tax=Arcella intermedia TaxID=1963864 RepID=A0A6B2LWK4_9EUKA
MELRWNPAVTVVRCLQSIYMMMEDPNADDPLDPDIARLYKFNRDAFNKTAREWVLKYAI